MKTLIKEPLVHFLFLGAVLFVVYGVINRDAGGGDGRSAVQITAQEVEWLKETWGRTWQRPPTDAELRGIIREYVREVLLAREAREMNLDQNDTVVRRRLAQKMKFLIEDIATREPTEEELRTVYDENPDRYRDPSRISFTHIYFSPDRRDGLAMADARLVLEELTQSGGGGSTPDLGDPFMLDSEYHDEDEDAVVRLFGRKFATDIFQLPIGEWRGPVASGYGAHLVRVIERRDSGMLDFDVVRDRVAIYWRTEYQREIGDEYIAALIEKYNVIYDESVQALMGPSTGDGAGP